MHTPMPIIPREKLDFGLNDDDIPRHWFGGDPFKTRFFDAMSTLFPEGERYFIASVRAWREDITDPKLAEDVKHFIRQEAQHGIVHTLYNRRLQAQGIAVDKIERFLHFLFARLAPKTVQRIQRLTDTAVTEHLTAIMAHCLFTNREVMAGADPRVRAMFAWHAIEEVEHKAVAYDVLIKVAKAGYLRRTFSLLGITFGFNLYSLLIANYMLKVDGFGLWARMKLMSRGAWWLFKPGGLYWPAIPHWRQFFRPGFHPWQSGDVAVLQSWLDAFAKTGDPVMAGETLYAASTGDHP